jgi:PKD repeat protein
MIRKSLILALFAFTVILIFDLPQAAYSKSTQQEVENLVKNGDFETGDVRPWEGLTAANLITDPTYSGSYAVRVTGEEASQGDIAVNPGQNYILTVWFRWEVFEGQGWGYDRISIINPDWSEAARLTNMHRSYESGKWHKLALAFTAQAPSIRIAFGMFGPQDQVELYFDDFRLVEKGENQPPAARAAASGIRGSAPFKVNFSANSIDEDGAVESHYWDFGDGTISLQENPVHTFLSAGTYSVKLTVRDNEGASATSYRTIFVTDEAAPKIDITLTRVHTSNQGQSVITLSGNVRAQPNVEIVRVVWDHISIGSAGILDITVGEEVRWTSPEIPLRPGRNEILITATDVNGSISTEKIILYRPLNRPVISNIETSSTEVGQYEKFEITFDLETVADNPFFRFDLNPPPGIPPAVGVNVIGIFQTPSGTTLEQPAFFHQEAEAVPCGSLECFQQTGNSRWVLRFAPQEIGDYQVKIRVKDSSGAVTVPVEGFTSSPSTNPGFVRVSKADPRYFEYASGDLFWPVGPAHGKDYASYKDTGQNFERPWMAGMGAYSTNFARWISSAKEMGNEGFDSNLVFNQRYPGHELAQVLTYPDANRLWIGWSSGEIFRPLLMPGSEYQLLLRIKTVNISGPVDPAYPHGLMIKTHGWPSETFEADMRQHPSLIPPVSANADWHTVVARYTATDRDGGNNRTIYTTLYLDNISSGEVYIDHFSIREIMSDGRLGREIMINASADLHTYVEPAPAAYFDWQVEQGEQNGVYFKYVVHDKRDWIQNHLNRYGLFVDSGDGYYQPHNTKARWLLEQWWRYLIARWGYSTAIHSWELNNEGPPNNSAHFQMAQDFARFMHENDSHPHLATTSFWSGWNPEFWNNRTKYPDVDYANIHEYIKDRQAAFDIAGWMENSSTTIFQSQVVIPVMKGETGIGGPSDDIFAYLSEPNHGIWYHNLLWAQLSSRPVYNPNYWWSQHLRQIERREISRAFTAFIADVDLNRGGYSDAGARSENSNLRIIGQKNLETNRAHLWVQNNQHTWRNVMEISHPQPIAAQSGSLMIKMNPNTIYTVEWWDTDSGRVSRTEKVASDASGDLTLIIKGLESDLAVKVNPAER